MRVAVAREVAEVGERLVAGVEETQLHQFVRHDVCDELDFGLLEFRPAEREVVFEHPLRERLADDWPGVVDAEARLHLLDVGRRGDRRDAVDHGVRECDVGFDPLAERLVLAHRVGGEHLVRNFAVGLDVVGTHDGERRDTAITAAAQCLDGQAEDGRRRGIAGEVGGDRRVVVVEVTSDVMEVIAALGDRQRHDARRGGSHQLDDALGIVRCVQVVDDGADDVSVVLAVRVLHDQRVQAVLRLERVAHAHVARHHADAADAPVHRQPGVHQTVHVHRLMRAVETAGAEVDDAHRDLGAVVGRARDACRELRQSGIGELQHVCLVRIKKWKCPGIGAAARRRAEGGRLVGSWDVSIRRPAEHVCVLFSDLIANFYVRRAE